MMTGHTMQINPKVKCKKCNKSHVHVTSCDIFLDMRIAINMSVKTFSE